MAALNGALAHLTEADDVGNRTAAKMTDQTAKLEKMGKHMDQVNANLDTTEAIIGDVEKSYFQYLTESGLSAVGIDMSTKVIVTKVDTSTPALKEGYLLKRGPMFGYKWETRWCALYETGMVWYDSDKKQEKKGDMDIKKVTKALSFQKNKAPGDAIKHRGEKPFGFVVDVTPNVGPGKERRLFYFDGETKEIGQEWVEAIEGVARRQKRKDKDKDTGLAGDTMGQIKETLDSLHDTALDLGVEAKKQGKLVKQLTGQVDGVTVRLDSQTERVNGL